MLSMGLGEPPKPPHPSLTLPDPPTPSQAPLTPTLAPPLPALAPPRPSPQVCFSLGSGVADFRRLRWLPGRVRPRPGRLVQIWGPAGEQQTTGWWGGTAGRGGRTHAGGESGDTESPQLAARGAAPLALLQPHVVPPLSQGGPGACARAERGSPKDPPRLKSSPGFGKGHQTPSPKSGGLVTP